MIDVKESLNLIFSTLPDKIDRDLSLSFVRYNKNEINNEEFKLIVQFENPEEISIGYENNYREFIPIEYHFPNGECYGSIWNINDVSNEKLIVAFSQTFGWIEEFQ